MRKLIFILLLFPTITFGQRPVSYKIVADSVSFRTLDNTGSELIIENDTKDTTGGFLTNVQNGRTQFKKVRIVKLNDSTYVVKAGTTVLGDTIKIISSGGSGGGGGSGTVTNVATNAGSGITGGPITSTGTIAADTGVLSTKANVIAMTQGKANQAALNDTAAALRLIRVVDTIFKNAGGDSIVFRIKGVRYAIVDKDNYTSTFSLSKNSTRDSIITIHDGTRSAVKDSVGTGTVTSIATNTGSGITGGTITGTGTIAADTTILSTKANVTAVAATKQDVLVSGTTLKTINSNSLLGSGDLAISATPPLSAITAATGSNTIANGTNAQEWQWGNLTASSFGIKLSSAATNALNNITSTAPSILSITKSGAHSGTNTFTRCASFINTSTGTGSRNTALYAEASGAADANYALEANGDILISKSSLPTIYFSTSTSSGYIRRNGNYWLFDAPASSTGIFFNPRTNGQAFVISNVSPTNFYDAAITLSPQSNTKQSIVLGGDAYRSFGTTVATITREDSKLIFSSNTGTASGFGGSYTPNDIMTVYGVNSNVGVGTTTPVASAALQIVSTTKGFLPPVMTSTQASAIASPATGLMLFVSDTNGTFTSVGWWGYDGAAWQKLNN